MRATSPVWGPGVSVPGTLSADKSGQKARAGCKGPFIQSSGASLYVTFGNGVYKSNLFSRKITQQWQAGSMGRRKRLFY